MCDISIMTPMDTNRYDSEVTVTFKCKFCKRVEQRVYPVRTEYREWYGHRYVEARYAAMHNGVWDEYKFGGPGSHFSTPCECGKSMVGRSIQGVVNPSVACNTKCTGATGHVCECSCGGVNHGAAHRISLERAL